MCTHVHQKMDPGLFTQFLSGHSALAPWPVMEPGPPAGECGVLTTGAPGSCQCSITSTSHALEATQMRIRKLTQTPRWAKGRSTREHWKRSRGCIHRECQTTRTQRQRQEGAECMTDRDTDQKTPQRLQAKEKPRRG